MESFDFVVESRLRGSYNNEDPQQSSFHGHITVKTPDERLVAITLFDGLKVKIKVKVLGIEILGLTGDNADAPTEVDISGMQHFDDTSTMNLMVTVNSGGKLYMQQVTYSDAEGYIFLPWESSLANADALTDKLKRLLSSLALMFANMVKSSRAIIHPA